MSEPERCASCRFWRRQTGEDYGFCKRFPPILVVARLEESDRNALIPSVWPETEDWNWCGEWRAKAAEAAPEAGKP